MTSNATGGGVQPPPLICRECSGEVRWLSVDKLCVSCTLEVCRAVASLQWYTVRPQDDSPIVPAYIKHTNHPYAVTVTDGDSMLELQVRCDRLHLYDVVQYEAKKMGLGTVSIVQIKYRGGIVE